MPNWHDAQNMVSLFDLSSFTGSVEITSTAPIVTLSLNFEAAPVSSSLPPGGTRCCRAVICQVKPGSSAGNLYHFLSVIWATTGRGLIPITGLMTGLARPAVLNKASFTPANCASDKGAEMDSEPQFTKGDRQGD